MSGNIEIKIDVSQYNRVIQMLKELEGKSEESVYKKAVNETAKKAQKALVKRTKQTYRGEAPKEVRSRSFITKGTTRDANAVIHFKSEQPSLTKHSYRTATEPTKTVYRNGKRAKFPVYVQQLKNRKLIKAKDGDGNLAFTVKFSNGHIGIVNRVPGKTRYGHDKIKTWMGSSDKAMVSNEKVYGQEENNIMETLVDECNKALWKTMGGKK